MLREYILVITGFVSITLHGGEIACWGDGSFGATISPEGNLPINQPRVTVHFQALISPAG